MMFVVLATQLSQAAYFALQPPYTVFGLGRTPNFVEELIVGLPRSETSVCLMKVSFIKAAVYFCERRFLICTYRKAIYSSKVERGLAGGGNLLEITMCFNFAGNIIQYTGHVRRAK